MRQESQVYVLLFLFFDTFVVVVNIFFFQILFELDQEG